MSDMQLAGCIIKDDQGRVLLLHRNTPGRIQWEIPGGKVEAGENPDQAALREIGEELGVEVKIITQIGSKSFKEDGVDYNYYWFEAKIISGIPHLAEPEKFDKLEYFDKESLSYITEKLSENTKNFIAYDVDQNR